MCTESPCGSWSCIKESQDWRGCCSYWCQERSSTGQGQYIVRVKVTGWRSLCIMCTTMNLDLQGKVRSWFSIKVTKWRSLHVCVMCKCRWLFWDYIAAVWWTHSPLIFCLKFPNRLVQDPRILFFKWLHVDQNSIHEGQGLMLSICNST